MAYAPDKDIPYHGPKDDKGGKKKGGNSFKIGFMPGQIAGLADDMSDGYGGKDAKWKNYLHNIYAPVKMPNFDYGARGGGGNGKGGGKGDPTGPGSDPSKPDLSFDPSRPDHKMAPMAMPYGGQPGAQMMQQPMQGLLNVGPMGQMTPPTLGLLGQPQQQMQQRKPQAGILPPEIQAMLTQRR